MFRFLYLNGVEGHGDGLVGEAVTHGVLASEEVRRHRLDLDKHDGLYLSLKNLNLAFESALLKWSTLETVHKVPICPTGNLLYRQIYLFNN